jgi:hypothetical protein
MFCTRVVSPSPRSSASRLAFALFLARSGKKRYFRSLNRQRNRRRQQETSSSFSSFLLFSSIIISILPPFLVRSRRSHLASLLFERANSRTVSQNGTTSRIRRAVLWSTVLSRTLTSNSDHNGQFPLPAALTEHRGFHELADDYSHQILRHY